MRRIIQAGMLFVWAVSLHAQEFHKPYSAPSVERENVFAFTRKPVARFLGDDKYEITFAVKGYCDVTVAMIDPEGKVVRHLGSGVLGSNAPAPFQKNSLSQTIIWKGKDDLGDYPKSPEKLKLRVMLGLKPEFHRRLGGSNPKKFPGSVWGIGLDESGVYVIVAKGLNFSHTSIRKFDREGKYLHTFFPPPANRDEKNMTGSRYIEYEKGKRAWQGTNLYNSVSGASSALEGVTAYNCQVALAGKRLIYCNQGRDNNNGLPPSAMHSINTDGTTDYSGLKGRPFAWGCHRFPRFVSSPDGKWVYMTGIINDPVVVRAPADGSKKAAIILGKKGKPGSDNEHLNHPSGIDCDAQGRIYVADSSNNRIQILSPEGKFLKSIRVERPGLVRVHQKTGAIYVMHLVRVKAKSISRLTKFGSFKNPVALFHTNNMGSDHLSIDSWSAKPRIWLAGGAKKYAPYSKRVVARHGIRIFEEGDKKFSLIQDFSEQVKKEGKGAYQQNWAGDCFDKVVCDPTREHVYYRNRHVYDLNTGKNVGHFSPARRAKFDDMSFDRRGFMHVHFYPSSLQGVGRMDPARAIKDNAKRTLQYQEVPYDYGVEQKGWQGVIHTKDQGGPKTFQDGFGVNMMGDIAEECNIYHMPKMEEAGWTFAAQSIIARRKKGAYVDGGAGGSFNNFAKYSKMIMEKEKRGEKVYAIKRRPGIPLVGGTVWTFDRHGELLKECAVIAGDLINGTQIDEDRSIYFVNARPKYYEGKPYLYKKSGVFGAPEGKQKAHPFTGTVIKTRPDQFCNVLLRNAVIPMDPLPKREPDVMAMNFMSESYFGKGSWCWLDGAEWLYAGASPITSVGCSCPRQHLGLDWYKRTFVPEAYRHSIGVLDTNGNLILHIGQYGNFDSASGPKSQVPTGGDGIGLMITRFISATDNYLTYGDWGERLVALKLNYHVEETVAISFKR